jgi:hypothetical protein
MKAGISTRDSQLMKIKRAKGLKYALADFVKDCVRMTWLSFVSRQNN